jgi:hypothetical protein
MVLVGAVLQLTGLCQTIRTLDIASRPW